MSTNRDAEPCLCDTPFTCLARHDGCYICRPGDPSASDEGCATCEARSDAYHAALTPLPIAHESPTLNP